MRKAPRVTACIVVLFTVAANGSAGAETRTTSELLLDLARDYGLRHRGQQTDADVQHVRTLLRAAVRLDDELAEAYTWLYELAQLAGNDDEAARALSGLLAADAGNERAFGLWLAAGIESQQTIEQALEWLDAVAESKRPPGHQSLIRVQRARLALEQLDTTAARLALQEAIELDPHSLDAASLLADVLDREAEIGLRLRAMLRVVELNPTSIEAAWRVGLLLDRYGFADRAAEFFTHAQDLYAQATDGARLPGSLQLDLARNRMRQGDLAAARELATRAIQLDPASAAEAGLLLHYLQRRAGNTATAQETARKLAERFAAIREPSEWPVNEVAQAAWFYCTIDRQPERALMLAQSASARAADSTFVRRVLGWARSLNAKPEAALEALLPIADEDAYAAWMAAKLLRETGEEARAAALLAALDPVPVSGRAAELLAETDAFGAATQPAERYPEVAHALASYEARTRDFAASPDEYVEATVRMLDRSPEPAEPWVAEFTLRNRGPFAITLGPDAMLNPVFLVSYRVEGDRTREYAGLCMVAADRLNALAPGEQIRVRQTLDVGPPRRISRHTPQHLQRFVLTVLLDADWNEAAQRWEPGLVGQQLDTVYFNRVPVSNTRAALASAMSHAADADSPARWQAIELLAQLWGEQQRAQLQRLNYTPGRIRSDRIRNIMLDLLDRGGWEVRVHVLEGLQIVGLDREVLTAVEQCLDHDHWLVRLMALRVVARQGPTAAERMRSVARYDADELVRTLAETYLKEWGTPSKPSPETAPARDDEGV